MESALPLAHILHQTRRVLCIRSSSTDFSVQMLLTLSEGLTVVTPNIVTNELADFSAFADRSDNWKCCAVSQNSMQRDTDDARNTVVT